MDTLKGALRVEKRLILLVLMLFFGVLITWQKQKGLTYGEIPMLLEKKINFINALNQIKAGHNWKPKGDDSGGKLMLPEMAAGAVIDLESGEVFWSLNLKEKIAPASLSKIATVMTALDISNRQKLITVSSEAADQIPTKLGLKAGERLTLEEAITASILTSANDATETIADFLGQEIGTGTTTFMELVNTKLKKIGATNSHFATATGLDSPDHFSTVYDLAIIAHEAKTNYPLIGQIASFDYKKLPANPNHRLFDLPNWNALLGTYPGVDGLKIGYTEAAGHVTMVTAQREGEKLIAIVVGAKSLEDREIAAATLLNYGFSRKGIEPFSIERLNLVKRFEDWRRQLSWPAPDSHFLTSTLGFNFLKF